MASLIKYYYSYRVLWNTITANKHDHLYAFMNPALISVGHQYVRTRDLSDRFLQTKSNQRLIFPWNVW